MGESGLFHRCSPLQLIAARDWMYFWTNCTWDCLAPLWLRGLELGTWDIAKVQIKQKNGQRKWGSQLSAFTNLDNLSAILSLSTEHYYCFLKAAWIITKQKFRSIYLCKTRSLTPNPMLKAAQELLLCEPRDPQFIRGALMNLKTPNMGK